MYAWSLRSLARRTQCFGIQFNDHDVEVNEVDDVVKKEISGPGKLLGYRAMHKKIWEIQGLQVPRELVYAVMTKVDPDGLEETKRPRRDKVFVSRCVPVLTKDGRYKILNFSLF